MRAPTAPQNPTIRRPHRTHAEMRAPALPANPTTRRPHRTRVEMRAPPYPQTPQSDRPPDRWEKAAPSPPEIPTTPPQGPDAGGAAAGETPEMSPRSGAGHVHSARCRPRPLGQVPATSPRPGAGHVHSAGYAARRRGRTRARGRPKSWHCGRLLPRGRRIAPPIHGLRCPTGPQCNEAHFCLGGIGAHGAPGAWRWWVSGPRCRRVAGSHTAGPGRRSRGPLMR